MGLPATIGQFPAINRNDARRLSTTPPPWERPEKSTLEDSLFREAEVGHAYTLLKTDVPAIIFSGEGGAGKSTTIRELAHVLDSRDIPFGIFSAKTLASDLWVNQGHEKAQELIDLYKNYKHPRASKLPRLPVLMDSGDYLYARPIGGSKLDFLTLRGLAEKGAIALHSGVGTLSQTYTAYYYQNALITALKNPDIAVVTTRHTNWPDTSVDHYLKYKWEAIIADKATDIKLSPSLEPAKMRDYLRERKDLEVSHLDSRLLTYLSLIFTFTELKDLSRGEFDHLRYVAKSSESSDCYFAIKKWADKNLESRKMARSGVA